MNIVSKIDGERFQILHSARFGPLLFIGNDIFDGVALDDRQRQYVLLTASDSCGELRSA